MRAVGIICEYNPFHKGHALHIARAKEQAKADYVVCAMSGSVTQRGTFARHDKWTRARAALLSGADLVVELPARFACASAQEFAAGGVSLLASLGIITHLSFGCEPEALTLLLAAHSVLHDETPQFSSALREGLDAGLSYPRARAQAAARVCPGLDAALSLPNAALALEYLQALPDSIVPVPIAREGSGYHDPALTALSSATAIRAALTRGEFTAAMAAIPCPDPFEQAETAGDVHEEDALSQALLYRLRTMSECELAAIAGMDEGLHNRFLCAARLAASRTELIEHVKCKRYTWARLSRLCACTLLGVTQELAQDHPAAEYARILGFRREAAPLMKALRENVSVPLISKAADFDRQNPLFSLDVRAQDLWSLGCASPDLRACGRDFTTSPVIV